MHSIGSGHNGMPRPDRFCPVSWRLVHNLPFDIEQMSDMNKGLFRQLRPGFLVHIMDLAPDMRPAGHFPDGLIAIVVQFIEPGIAVGMQMAGKVFQNRLRMKTLAIRRIAVERGWRNVAAMGTFIAKINA